MSYRLKLIFSGQPAIDDSITVNAQFIETFKATRSLQGETAIGADLDETILNLQNAFIADYQGLFPFTTSIDDNVLILNFLNYSESFFDIVINSSVITFELIEGYFPYFRSIYDNKVDDFELVILGQDPTFTEENISATGILSYKDVDNILEPIRGAELQIDIDANIEKPYNLFFDFREKDYKVEFYRNGDLIFLGFINAEGVVQSYNTINWRAQLVAVDNLGALKNTEHPYTSEVPSEFVFMDLALKKTGLDLPIAFFDDINQNYKLNLNTVPYLTKLEDPINERLIEPDTFKNNNGRFANCEDVLLDILQKYNAILVQQPITYLNIDTGQEETTLCWLFARPAIMNRAITNFNSDFKIKKITGYTDTDGVLFPDVIDYNYKFGIPFRRIGTDGQATQFQPLNAIHKNKNQLLRQTRATKAFRFVHKYIEKNTFYDYDYENFDLIETYDPNLGFELNNKLAFKDYRGGFDQLKAQFVSNEIQLPDLVDRISLKGNATITPLTNIAIPSGRSILGTLLYTIVHKDLNGNYRQMQAIRDTSLPFGSPRPSDYLGIEFQDIGTGFPSNITDFRLFSFLVVSTYQFVAYDSSFSIENIPLVTAGGSIKIYISQFTTPVLGITQAEPEYSYAESFWRRTQLELKEFNVEFAVTNNTLGEGNYYDAENTQDVSSKIGEPIEIINADDKSDVFLNGIKRSYGDNANYPFWTSFWNLDPNRADILELMSIERIRLLSKSQNIFSGDIHGYIPYFSRLVNTAYPADPQTGSVYFVFTKWVYDTAENTIQSEMMECKTLSPSVDFEKSVIFEEEDKKLSQ